MQASSVLDEGVYLGEVLRSSSILFHFTSCWVSQFVGREIVKIHLTCVWVISKDILIKPSSFFKFFNVFLSVAMVLIHDIAF